MNSRETIKDKGFTTLEVIFVVGLMSLILAAITPLFRTAVTGWEVQDRRLEIIQISRLSMDKMIRELKTAIEFMRAEADRVEFKNWNSEDIEYKLTGTVLKRNNSSLAEPVDSLTFTYYDLEGNQTTDEDDVYSIKIAMTVSDSESKVVPVTFTSRVVMRKDPAAFYQLVINEINYNPPGTGANERKREWVELYNYGSTAISLTGWEISDGSSTDDLEAGNGTMTIPAGGYAIITANPTDVYTYYTVAPGAVRLQVDDDKIGNGLGDNSDTITIRDSNGDAADSVTYDDSWGGDGDGDTIERKEAETGSNEPTNWEASSVQGSHTPGSENTVSE